MISFDEVCRLNKLIFPSAHSKMNAYDSCLSTACVSITASEKPSAGLVKGETAAGLHADVLSGISDKRTDSSQNVVL